MTTTLIGSLFSTARLLTAAYEASAPFWIMRVR